MVSTDLMSQVEVGPTVFCDLQNFEPSQAAEFMLLQRNFTFFIKTIIFTENDLKVLRIFNGKMSSHSKCAVHITTASHVKEFGTGIFVVEGGLRLCKVCNIHINHVHKQTITDDCDESDYQSIMYCFVDS